MQGIRTPPDVRARVLEEFAKCGRVDKACANSGISRSAFFDWLKEDPEYKAEFDRIEATDVARLLIDECKRRALEGVDEPRTVAGEREVVRVYSDRLLERLLEARVEAFRRNIDINGKIAIDVGQELSKLLAQRRAERIRPEQPPAIEASKAE
jgi:hypothetical protein